MKRLAVASLATLLFISLANATLIPSLDGVTNVSPGLYNYSYHADLSSGSRLDPAATNGVTCPGASGPVQCQPPGTFFTMYDIGGFSGVTSTPGGWYAVTQFTGVTPSSINGATLDGPAMNVSFFYVGAPVSGPSSFSGFGISSTFNTTRIGNYSYQDTFNTGLTGQGTGFVTLPFSNFTPLDNPEPSTVALLGAGLLALSLVRRKMAR